MIWFNPWGIGQKGSCLYKYKRQKKVVFCRFLSQRDRQQVSNASRFTLFIPASPPEGKTETVYLPEGIVARHEVPGSMQRGLVLEGRSKLLSVPQILSSKLSPGMSKRQRVECPGRFRNARYSR